ncbi:MAG: hypothetical protein P8X65_07900 [Syntrophobacterales bacterium]
MIDRFLCGTGRIEPLRGCTVVGLLLMVLFLVGCPRLSPSYQPEAYGRAIDLKVEALNLMDKATEPYAQHQAAADTLRLNLEKAYEAAKGIPKNEMSTQMWAILKDPNGNLLGGFLKMWQEKSVLNKPFIDAKKVQVGDAFDKIIALETGKVKS